ncbi:hypothetical protein [Sphingosinicella terrae]|uniref:hypothetical protein n=1 Tax=Sphingosinicella terrae TaxID=2172047 RepID=UPI000E0D3BE2|nr:hypothetical protein [Sphingosinicella terrae]
MIGEEERLEARPAIARRRPLLVYLLLAALFFLIGLAAAAWILSRWESGARMLGIAPEPPAIVQTDDPPVPEPDAAAIVQAPAEPGTSPERIVIDPEITRRVAEIERRITAIDTQSRVAVGNADRAEGLLVAFAARRALDRGVSLGFLEALLRQRFGDTQPQAVGTIITSAREPVTLQELQDGLQEVGPRLAGGGPEQGWWQAFKSEMASLVSIRREGTPSTEPAERLRRATRRLEAGQVDVALAEVLRLPAHQHAADWIAKARRYVIARRALDTIETAALLEPRRAAPAAVAPLPAASPTQAQQPPSSATQPTSQGQRPPEP